LIRHANTCPALPVRALAVPVRLSALFCLLVALVCCPSLPLARSGAAGLAAIALALSQGTQTMKITWQSDPRQRRQRSGPSASEAVAISTMPSLRGQDTADSAGMIDDVAAFAKTGESSENDDFR
jgi:hypothetical protein